MFVVEFETLLMFSHVSPISASLTDINLSCESSYVTFSTVCYDSLDILKILIIYWFYCLHCY